jgi:hypothetical protein
MALSARNLKTLARDRLGLCWHSGTAGSKSGSGFADLNMYDILKPSEKIALSSAVLIFLVMLFSGFVGAGDSAVIINGTAGGPAADPCVLSRSGSSPFRLYRGWCGLPRYLFVILRRTDHHAQFYTSPGAMVDRRIPA